MYSKSCGTLYDQITAEMAIGVVIFLSTSMVFLLAWFLQSQSSSILRWILLINTRRPRTAGFIPVQEDERAVIGKQMCILFSGLKS